MDRDLEQLVIITIGLELAVVLVALVLMVVMEFITIPTLPAAVERYMEEQRHTHPVQQVDTAINTQAVTR
tara:strand:+ start:86 stop:295 length:210 start_codon:yes stop_codon:yes gene_type:complete